MPKKSRRTKAKHRTPAPGKAQERGVQHAGPAPAQTRGPVRPSAVARDPDSRYQHVVPELKHIGVIAGVMILILIILSFILG